MLPDCVSCHLKPFISDLIIRVIITDVSVTIRSNIKGHSSSIFSPRALMTGISKLGYFIPFICITVKIKILSAFFDA